MRLSHPHPPHPPLRFIIPLIALTALAAAPSPAQASFHLWVADEVYSNASGTVQFVEFTTTFTAQNLFGTGQVTLEATSGSNGTGTDHSVTLAPDLAFDTTNHHLLIATPGFAAIAGVTPDYTMPANTLFLAGGSVHFHSIPFSEDSPTLNYTLLPSDGIDSLNVSGPNLISALNTPTNFAGTTGAVPEPATLTLLTLALTPLLLRRRRKPTN